MKIKYKGKKYKVKFSSAPETCCKRCCIKKGVGCGCPCFGTNNEYLGEYAYLVESKKKKKVVNISADTVNVEAGEFIKKYSCIHMNGCKAYRVK